MAVYHLMERGVHRQRIFEDDMDFQVFLEIMRVAQEKFKCTIHAYCLMSNHFHLLLETADIEAGRFMQYLAGNYAVDYNHKHDCTGHLFEGRYKGYLVKTDSYFLQTSRYIHLNPVKAGMVICGEDYPWSSYQTMLGMTDDRITYVDRTWKYFPKNPTFRYREFVEDVGHKYHIDEQKIQKDIEEDELWL